MEPEDVNSSGAVNLSDASCSAVNSLILDYYKKFGRKRDLEQYFSLSTAQSDIRDPTSLFWKKMKSHNESSDSGEKKSESSTELCRISIKCTMPEPSSSQEENLLTKSDSEGSPPIITEEVVASTSHHSDYESVKSDGNNSQKSIDATLDMSINKVFSPTSSITSQRKLEWDSLADVGYANESDKKASASSLSTLERLALKQQYSNNDTKEKSNLGHPTAQSTPLEDNINASKSKGKKALVKKTKFYKKDVDFVEFNMPHTSQLRPSQAISVNLTKHISFSVEKDGGVTVEEVNQNISVSPEKNSLETEIKPHQKMDKEIQTSLQKTKEKSSSLEKSNVNKLSSGNNQMVPVLIGLNTLRRRNRRKKFRATRRKLRSKKNDQSLKENIHERSINQVSEAESFEYMPGHIYNQNQIIDPKNNSAGNKSSLESSGPVTTDSSKRSKNSFSNDLEKSISLLKTALQKQNKNSHLKKKLIREVVQKLLKSKYRDDGNTTEFLIGLTSCYREIGLSGTTRTTTSTSENSGEKSKLNKSVLKSDNLKDAVITSTSQSAPNLPSTHKSEIPTTTSLMKPLIISNTESDMSSKEKNSSDSIFEKASSSDLYQKYLNALRREEAYKRHLRDKEAFLKHKLVCSENAIKMPAQLDKLTTTKLQELMKDLTRNNYDDGSGDASKLEGGSSNTEVEKLDVVPKQRSHSVFTLSSGNSDCHNKKKTIINKSPNESCSPKAGTSKGDHYCCCPYHSSKNKIGVTDSSVQVNIRRSIDGKTTIDRPTVITDINQNIKLNANNIARVIPDDKTGDIKYVCIRSTEMESVQELPDNILIYKCSRLPNKAVQHKDCILVPIKLPEFKSSTSKDTQSKILESPLVIKECCSSDDISGAKKLVSCKSSQTNVNLDLGNLKKKQSADTIATVSSKDKKIPEKSEISAWGSTRSVTETKNYIMIYESTRCIQTEISLDPKISDPSFSDINIVDDTDLVQLISEHCKQVSKSNLKSDVKTQSDQSDIDTRSSSVSRRSTNIATSEDNMFGFDDFQADSNNILKNPQSKSNVTNFKQQENKIDNFTIPIQGTNMTLMVSIGSKTENQNKKSIDFVDQGVVTEKADLSEKATSLLEECAKAVQCQTDGKLSQIFNMKKDNPRDIHSNGLKNPVENVTVKKSCLINACLGESKYNTYPKSVQINERKPFLRSYTDVLENSCRTININNKDVATQKSNSEKGSQNFSEIKPEAASQTYVDQRSSEKNTQQKKENAKIQTEGTGTSPVDDYNSKNTCLYSFSSSTTNQRQSEKTSSNSGKSSKECNDCNDNNLDLHDRNLVLKKDSDRGIDSGTGDRIMEIIQDITKRFSKKDSIEKGRKKKCFKDILTVLNYLLDTEESTDHDIKKLSEISTTDIDVGSDTKQEEKGISSCSYHSKEQSKGSTSDSNLTQKKNKKDVVSYESCDTKNSIHCSSCQSKQSKEIKQFADKGVQLSSKKSKAKKVGNTESSEIPTSTDLPNTSTDSATCKVLNKIKMECEKYHQKRCKSHGTKKFEPSSSTSMNCERCKRTHHCLCRGHKCKGYKQKSSHEKSKKDCVAYNLIIQTSESMISEEAICSKNRRPLQNIIVKVPKCKQNNIPFQELAAKIERKLPPSPGGNKPNRSRSLPRDSEMSSTDDLVKTGVFTVRDYLETNRPDFVQKSTKRQNCLKLISEKRANEHAIKRELLSMQMGLQPDAPLNAVSTSELRHLARELGVGSNMKLAPKFISEREMKKHSEKIYKTLPEVRQKKEDKKKENIKKTNMLMADIFKKNLQKKALRGDINLSNYNTLIKI